MKQASLVGLGLVLLLTGAATGARAGDQQAPGTLAASAPDSRQDFKERQKVQLRFSAFNFLNHPLPQFGAAGNSDLQLNFADSNGNLTTTNQNKLTTGKPNYTVGRRVIEFTAKYNF